MELNFLRKSSNPTDTRWTIRQTDGWATPWQFRPRLSLSFDLRGCLAELSILAISKDMKKNSVCYLLFWSILGKIIWVSRWSVAVGWYNGSNTSPCSSLLCELEGNGSNELLQEQLPDRKYTLLPIIFIKLHYFNWRMGEISIKSSDLFGHTQGSNEVFILIQFYKAKINW